MKKLSISNFSEKKREEVISFLGEGKKLKLELSAALLLYSSILILWKYSAWKVEWAYRAVQLAFPLGMALMFRSSLNGAGINFQNLSEIVKYGLFTGIVLTTTLGLILVKWVPPHMPRNIESFLQLGFTLLLITTNVVGIELFFRGYIQPRLEVLTSSVPGLIICSILSGFDFWEAWTFKPHGALPGSGIIIVTAISLAFGLSYIKTRSVITPVLAHTTFLILLVGMISI